jgi:hypothetical protein
MPDPKEVDFRRWHLQYEEYREKSESVLFRIKKAQQPKYKGSPSWGWEFVGFEDDGYIVLKYDDGYGTKDEIRMPPHFLWDNEAVDKYIDSIVPYQPLPRMSSGEI